MSIVTDDIGPKSLILFEELQNWIQEKLEYNVGGSKKQSIQDEVNQIFWDVFSPSELGEITEDDAPSVLKNALVIF